MVNCPVMYLLWILNGKGFAQSASTAPVKWPRSHNHLKVGKSMRAGAKMMFWKIHGVKKKARTMKIIMAEMERTICQRNSSRWSRKDISFSSLIKKVSRICIAENICESLRYPRELKIYLFNCIAGTSS